jgi:hypothetical protein
MSECPLCEQRKVAILGARVSREVIFSLGMAVWLTALDLLGLTAADRETLPARLVLMVPFRLGFFYVLWQAFEHDRHEARPRTRYRIRVLGRLGAVCLASLALLAVFAFPWFGLASFSLGFLRHLLAR